MEVTTTRGVCRIPEAQGLDDSLELIASELCSPLDVLKLSAEGMVRQLRETHGDPSDISAAETLVHSAESMSRVVQALLELSRGELP